MKKLVTILLLLIAGYVNCYSQYWFPSTVKIKNATKHDNMLIDMVLLNLSVRIFEMDTLTLIVKYSKDGSHDGYTQKVGHKAYAIYVSREVTGHPLKVLLCHEMIHVHQQERGDLILGKDFDIWKGEQVSKKTRYLLKPYEKEAYYQQTEIKKQLDELLKPYRL